MAEERTQRRLAAVLAADVVGFSRLMEQDESATLAALKTRRRQVLEPLVARHRGRIFKIAGDGVLIEFGSAVDAVECAVELQHEGAKAALKEFLRVAETDMAVFPGRKLKDWEPYWHGSFEYKDQKDFDHLFDGLRKAGLLDG
jgi:class 3 adenylate cyclase